MDLDISSNGLLTEHSYKNGSFPLNQFKMQDSGGISPSFKAEYKSPTFFKLSAGKLVSPSNRNFDSLEAEYFIQPSHLSNMKALQLHFPDKEDAQKLINSRKLNDQTRPNNRKVKNVFDPILTEEILQQLLGGEKTTLHNHDLISQAKAEELIDIINDSKYNDPTAIYYTRLDSDLAKLPETNVWRLQQSFIAPPDALYQDSSLLVRGELITAYGFPSSDDDDDAKQTVTLTEQDRPKIVFGASTEANFAYVGSYNGNVESIELRNPYYLLDVEAGSLKVHGSLDLTAPTSPAGDIAQVVVDAELTGHSNMLVTSNFISNGFQMFGCESGLEHCPQVSVVKGSKRIINSYEIGASQYIDINNSSYYFDLSETSVINQLELKGSMNSLHTSFSVGKEFRVSGDLSASNAQIGKTSGAYVESTKLITSNSAYYSDPSSLSVWNSLQISGQLEVEPVSGRMEVLGLTSIQGSINASSVEVLKDTTIQKNTIAPRFIDLDDINLSLNPNSISTIQNLIVSNTSTMNGHLNLGGNLTQGTTMYISGNLIIDNTVETSKFVDLDDLAFLAQTQIKRADLRLLQSPALSILNS